MGRYRVPVAPALALILTVVISACRARSSIVDCEWPPDRAGFSTTLLDDVRLAEDVAIRHADSHGYREGWRATREACEAILFAVVASSWNLTSDDVRRARAQLDHREFDWAVNVPVAVLSLVAAWVQVWAFAVETIRIGNGHMSYRAFRIPWRQHRIATFAIVVLAVWLMTLTHHLGTRTPHPGTHP